MNKLLGKKEEQPQDTGMEIPPPPNLDQNQQDQTGQENFGGIPPGNQQGGTLGQQYPQDFGNFSGTQGQQPDIPSPQETFGDQTTNQNQQAFESPQQQGEIQQQDQQFETPQQEGQDFAFNSEQETQEFDSYQQSEQEPKQSQFTSKQKVGEKEFKKRREEIRLSEEPLFTKIEDYKAILEASDHMKSSLKDCDEILKRLNEIKVEEDKEYEKWKKMLLDTYRKIHYIDRTFFEQKQ
ncbi:MAG: hypothetical protein ACLFP2_03135 [Candidatus Woesearchaeota archaeon]